MQSLINPPLSRRQLLQWMGGVAGVSIAAGCVAASQNVPPPAQAGEAVPARAPGKISVAQRQGNFGEMETVIAQAITTWGQEQNVVVDFTVIRTEAIDDLSDWLATQVQGDTPPDLLYHERLVQSLQAQNLLAPLSEAVAEAESLYGKATPTHQQQEKIEGHWYGLPYRTIGRSDFARKDLFAAASIDPLGLKTFDDRRTAALKVSDVTGQHYGWGIPINQSKDGHRFVESVIQNWGGSYTAPTLTEITFDSPETVAAVEWLAETYLSETFQPMLPPDLMQWSDTSNDHAYLAGKIAFTHNDASLYAQMKANHLPLAENTLLLETAVGPLGKKLAGGDGGYWVMPTGAANREAALSLALHLLQPTIFLTISLISAGLFLPAYANYTIMDEVVKAKAADPNLKRMSDAAQGAYAGSSYPAQPNSFFDVIQSEAVLEDMLAQIIANSVKPADAVAQAAERIQGIADEMQALQK